MLRFSMFGVPVGVRPSFWLVALLLGFDRRVPADRLVPYLGMWVGIVLVSVLAHELGHALVARRLGAGVSITLFALGGFTSWSTRTELRPLQRVAIAAAGSFVGFVLGGLGWLALSSGSIELPAGLPRLGLTLFVMVNVFWGILNWLPIRPLDGGHIFSGLLQALSPRRGETVADVVFPLVTVAAAIWAWTRGLVFATLLAAFVLIDEFRRWNDRRPAARAGPAEASRVPPETPFRLFDEEDPPPGRPEGPGETGR